jgi:Domain of unknown function (DUF222)
MGRVAKLCAQLRAALVELEPGTYTSAHGAALAEELATTEKVCSVAKARMAARAASCGEHRRRGFADASDWLASATGATTSEARRELDAAREVEHCPDTREALIAGDVSLAQAGEIARTAAEVPGCEQELLSLACGESLGKLREAARTRRAEAIPPEELYARQHEARELRHWRDDLGNVCGGFALTPEVGVPLVDRIDAETERMRRAARTANRTEPREALAADAFVAVVNGTVRSGAGAPALNIVIDWPALARDHAHPHERAHIVGGGPIPPWVARELLGNAFVKAVVTDGVEVLQVRHFGRRISAELRTALELGPPPGFAGVTCAELGCDRRHHLEWDHRQPVAAGGFTSLANLQPLCYQHHRETTARDTADSAERSPP